MRNPKRIEPIIQALINHNYLTPINADFLRSTWEASPDYRLGQLLVNTQPVPACNELLQKVCECIGDKDPFFLEELEIMTALGIPTREYFIWGSRGVNGDQPLTYKPLKELDDDHLKLIVIHLQERVDNGENLEQVIDIINKEIALRKA